MNTAMASSASAREVEYDCVANAKFLQEVDDAAAAVDDASPLLRFDPTGSHIRLSPEKNRRWKSNLHFHSDFCLPSNSPNKGLLLQLEGRAREGIAIALSLAPKYNKDTAEILFGMTGNTCTILCSHNNNNKKSAPGRVCRGEQGDWVSYWVCWTPSAPDDSNTELNIGAKLYAGVGAVPGQQCVAILDIPNPNTAERRKDPTAQEGESKEVKTEESDEPKPSTGSIAPPMMRYVGIRNAGRKAPQPLQVRNLRLTAVSDDLTAQLNTLDSESLEMIILGEDELQDPSIMMSSMDREAVELLCKYRDECVKAKARAVKFGVAYQPPALTTAMPWSQARRLRANPVASSGFVTGMDLQDDAEKEKQEKRKARFGLQLTTETSEPDENQQKETADMDTSKTTSLPVEQAWDKELLVRSQRVDPPSSLWKDPSPAHVEDKDEFRMEQAEEPVVLSEKIHLFSFDWAAFKQIRTNDILAHFSIYGPSYVEWLGDLSCNVLFEDKYSAARALENMSLELPSPPPTTTDEQSANGDEACAEEPPNLGRMGWRLGKTVLKKVSNDRHGQRGTKARLLMRFATSHDVLLERPNKWLKPPKGFSTKRVLGPESDLVGQRKKKKTKKRDRGDNDREVIDKPVTTEGLLSGGLSSGRAGFSVEEMEAERAKKRARVSET